MISGIVERFFQIPDRRDRSGQRIRPDSLAVARPARPVRIPIHCETPGDVHGPPVVASVFRTCLIRSAEHPANAGGGIESRVEVIHTADDIRIPPDGPQVSFAFVLSPRLDRVIPSRAGPIDIPA
jgi:hypothetical protein